MRFNLKNMVLRAAWTAFPDGSVHPQDAIDKLEPLVETSVRRLAIAEQVRLCETVRPQSRAPLARSRPYSAAVALLVARNNTQGVDQVAGSGLPCHMPSASDIATASASILL